MRKEIILMDELKTDIRKEQILRLLKASPDQPAFEDTVMICDELKPLVLQKIRPAAVLAFSEISAEQASAVLPAGSEVLYAVLTLGAEISTYIDRCFRENHYLRAMIADTMADTALFAAEKSLRSSIMSECRSRGYGIACRCEAPAEIPVIYQQYAFDETQAASRLGMAITSGYMYEPVKSMAVIYRLKKDSSSYQMEHDCKSCPKKDCPVRHVQDCNVTVVSDTGRRVIRCREGQTLLEAVRRSGIYMDAPCAGKGKCGKCGVLFLSEAPEASEADRRHLSETEIGKGIRLACTAHPAADCMIRLLQTGQAYETAGMPTVQGTGSGEKAAGKYDIAVDIGTTTIAFALVRQMDGQAADGGTGMADDGGTGMADDGVTDACSLVNSQRQYGADVVSRIQASCEGNGAELQRLIRADLQKGIVLLKERNQIRADQIGRIAVAGNTTMEHLLEGHSCEGLGRAPFHPVDISLHRSDVGEVILPGISAYIGADITAGLYDCGFAESEEICLLLDLGTNGEMALGSRERILTASAAVGPAFEGGSISCGMGSVAGAISHVRIIDKNHVEVSRIGGDQISGNQTGGNQIGGNQTDGKQKTAGTIQWSSSDAVTAEGLCGSGVIDAAAELVRTGIADRTGLFAEEFFEKGFPIAHRADGTEIIFTQKDMRELQLAKAAVRAGIDTLTVRYGIHPDQIRKVYLAGGFGFALSEESAIGIGMLPENFRGKTITAGNTSLQGTVRFLRNRCAGRDMERMIRNTKEITLADEEIFRKQYLESMNF